MSFGTLSCSVGLRAYGKNNSLSLHRVNRHSGVTRGDFVYPFRNFSWSLLTTSPSAACKTHLSCAT